MIEIRRSQSLALAIVLSVACAIETDAVAAPAAAPRADAAGTQVAAAPPARTSTVGATGSRRSRRTVRRRRGRRAARPLRLPEVTRYGIPRLHVKAAYVFDATNNRVLFQKNPERALPVASLTKLVTALVLFETDPQFDRVIEILPEDVRQSSRSHIRTREEITVRDLLHASLMSSDNVATKALARSSGLTREEFVGRMNALADSLGLAGTRFVEPTGLSELNIASAQGIARLLRAAGANPIVSAIMQKPSYIFTSNRKTHRLANTNRLLHSKWRVTAGKTGFIRESGYCLATNIETPSGLEVTAVLLGAPSNALRFAEARRLLDWSFRFGLAGPDTNPGAP